MFKKIFGLILVSVLLLSISSSALEVMTGDKVVVPKGQVVDDNLFAAGEKVKISGRIKGDLIVFGGEVVIDGVVDGNVIVGGGDVKMTGVAKNVFMGGGDVEMNGVVRKDLLVGCGDLSFNEKARVGKDAFLGCGEAKIAGKVYRNLKIGVGDLFVAPTALVKGTLGYSADNVIVSDDATVFGTIASYARPNYKKEAEGFLAGVALTHKILAFFTILLMGILAIVFVPNQVNLVTSKMISEFWKSLGWGILSLILIPLISILLFVTLIGIPLGILLLIVYAFGIFVAGIFTSVVIGTWILAKLGKPGLSLIWALLLGLIAFKLITALPVVGGIAGIIFLFWAFGALVSTRFVCYKNAREKGVL